jgi:ribosomal protein S19E (S16A)
MSRLTYYELSTCALLRRVADGDRLERHALRTLQERGLITGHPARLTPAGQAMLDALEAAGEDEP